MVLTILRCTRQWPHEPRSPIYDTFRRWVPVLCELHLGFLIRPWSRSVASSLRKEPR